MPSKISTWSIRSFLLSLILLLLTVGYSCSGAQKKTLIVESMPQGAKVYIGEKFVGNTPLALSRSEEIFLKSNAKQILKLNIVLEGFHEYQTTLTAANYYQVTLIPYERDLTIHFTPAPTRIYIDRKLITFGTTKKNTVSVTLPLSLGEHEIFAYKENYPFLERLVSLSRQSPREIRLPLSTERFQNALSITGFPQGVEVYYQGKLLGITPLSLKNLKPSPFNLEFKKPGYENKSVVFNLLKKEHRPVVARLTALQDQFKLKFSSMDQNSKIAIDEELVIAEILPLADHASLPLNTKVAKVAKVDMVVTVPYKPSQVEPRRNYRYRYRIVHPKYYPVVGSFTATNTKASGKAIDAPITLTIRVDQVPHISSAPRLIVRKSLPDIFVNVESDFHKVQSQSQSQFQLGKGNNKTGEYFFLSTPTLEELRVYDRGFNEIRRYDFSKVGERDIPRLTIGFDYREYPEPLRLLVGNRIVGQEVVFSFNGRGTAETMVTPAYVLPLELNVVAIFDNGHHALKIYELGSPSTLVKEVQAFNFFKLRNQDPRSVNILPLRFQQAVFLPPTPLQDTDTSQLVQTNIYNNLTSSDSTYDARLVFTDIVNRDVKEYRFNSKFLLTGLKEYPNDGVDEIDGVDEVGYFIPRYNQQPDAPGAITSYRGLVLLAERENSNPSQVGQTAIWVYDREGNFIHTFSLSSNKAVEYLYTLGTSLYVFTDKELELYSLVP